MPVVLQLTSFTTSCPITIDLSTRRIDMQDTDLSNADFIAASTDEEISVMTDFRRKYKILIPPPVATNVTLLGTIGWQFWLIILQAFAAIILAAMRTASMFFEVAQLGIKIPAISFTEAAAALVAIEGGIVVYATLRAEIQNRKADISLSGDGGRIDVRTSMSRLLVGEALGILISIVAGLGVSMKGLGMNATWFTPVLAFTIGIGASVIAAVSGDVLGVTLARLANTRDAIAEKFAVTNTAWEDRMYKAWNASEERKIARHELRDAVPVRFRRQANSKRTSERAKVSDVAKSIADYLGENSGASFVPGPSEIARDLGVSKGYAHRIRSEWIQAHAPLFAEQTEPEATIAT
jgi:hypothetical protein